MSDPRNDAAPSGNGASVHRPEQPKSIDSPMFPPAARSAPPGTSDVAARMIAPHVGTLRARILAFIEAQGPAGATDDEGELALGIKPQTYTPRRGELAALGWIRDTGRRRNTASGRPASVWIAVAHAREGRGG